MARKSNTHWSFSIARKLFSIARTAILGIAVTTTITHEPVKVTATATTATTAGIIYVKKGTKYVAWDGRADVATYCKIACGKRTLYAERVTAKLAVAA